MHSDQRLQLKTFPFRITSSGKRSSVYTTAMGIIRTLLGVMFGVGGDPTRSPAAAALWTAVLGAVICVALLRRQRCSRSSQADKKVSLSLLVNATWHGSSSSDAIPTSNTLPTLASQRVSQMLLCTVIVNTSSFSLSLFLYPFVSVALSGSFPAFRSFFYSVLKSEQCIPGHLFGSLTSPSTCIACRKPCQRRGSVRRR